MNEHEQGIATKDLLVEASRLPYNSTANIFRISGQNIDSTIYGTDYIGKIQTITGSLSDKSTVHYLVTSFKNIKHLAVIVNNEYLDPFLFQVDPINLENTKNTITVSKTLQENQIIKASQNQNTLDISLNRTIPNGIERSLITYQFNTSTATPQMPDPEMLLDESFPCRFNYVSQDGTFMRINYNHKKDIFTIVADIKNENFKTDILEYYNDILTNELGINLLNLREVFQNAIELQRYYTWLKKHSQ